MYYVMTADASTEIACTPQRYLADICAKAYGLGAYVTESYLDPTVKLAQSIDALQNRLEYLYRDALPNEFMDSLNPNGITYPTIEIGQDSRIHPYAKFEVPNDRRYLHMELLDAYGYRLTSHRWYRQRPTEPLTHGVGSN